MNRPMSGILGHQRLLYVLFPCEPQGRCAHVAVTPTSAQLLKSGRLAETTSFFNPGNVFKPEVGRFLSRPTAISSGACPACGAAGPRTDGIRSPLSLPGVLSPKCVRRSVLCGA